jgi:hypothetical protein
MIRLDQAQAIVLKLVYNNKIISLKFFVFTHKLTSMASHFQFQTHLASTVNGIVHYVNPALVRCL